MTGRSGAVPGSVPRRARRPSADADVLDLEGLGGQVGYLLRRAQLAVFAQFTLALQELRLRPGQYAVLRLVGNNPGVTQNEVCDALGIQRTNLVAVLDDLESRGLAARRPSPADRRSNELHLTAEGARVLARAIALQSAHEARLAGRLGTKGRAELVRLLERLADAS